MSITSRITEEKTKVDSFENFQIGSIERINVKTIFPNMDPIIKNPITSKRISKQPESSLNVKSFAKALGVFLTTFGIGFLIKSTNVFSYFKRTGKKSNSKNLQNSEIAKIENVINARETLEGIKEASNPFVNRVALNYKEKDETIKFKEINVEGFKNFKRESLKESRSTGRRSINVQNPIPDQNAILGLPFELTIDGNHVFGSSSSVFLEVTKISNWLNFLPLNFNPTFKGSYDTPGTAWGVTLSENYVYVTGLYSELQIIDVSDPSNPIFKGSYATSGNGAAISGNYLYLALAFSGLHVIDVSDPSNPTFKGLYNVPYGFNDVTLSGNYAYAVGDAPGDELGLLHIIDISNPSNPTFKGSYDIPGEAGGIVLSQNYAYVSYRLGLQIIDISNPSNPTFKGSYDTPGEAGKIVLSQNYAYMLADASFFELSLQIIDISNPSNPIFKGSYDTSGTPFDLVILGNYAYVAGGSVGLQIIDISNPSNPTLEASYDISRVIGVTVYLNYAYVAAGSEGLQIINLNPSKAVLSGTPTSAGTYRVGIKACNGVSECATDSFDIVVTDLTSILVIIGSVTGGVICAVSFLCTTIGCGIILFKRHRNKISKNENVTNEKELQKVESGDDKKSVVESDLPKPLDEQKNST
jgi:hypothetical protein